MTDNTSPIAPDSVGSVEAARAGVDLTPTQDLFMEVLAARFRLGETLWTFDSRHGTTAKALAEQGLIQRMGGVVAGTIRASMTSKGRAVFLDEHYTAPNDRPVAVEPPPTPAQTLYEEAKRLADTRMNSGFVAGIRYAAALIEGDDHG